MNTQKNRMTIHRALAELKVIDERISKGITYITPCGLHQKDKLIQGHVSKEDFEKSATAKYQSVIDLIARKSAIKSAIVQSNSITMVKIGEKEMSVADAINFKAVVDFKKELVSTLKSKHKTAVATLNRDNEVVQANVLKLLEMTFGKENVKATNTDVEAVRKPYVEANEVHLFDPLNAIEKAEAMEKEIEEFELEVDATLSESNATVFIEV